MQDTNYAIPTAMLRKRSHCLKRFVPLTQAGVFISENFHLGYRDLGRKNRDLGDRASPASHHMNTSKFLRRIARRDLGNRASPVDRTHNEEALNELSDISFFLKLIELFKKKGLKRH